MAYAMEWVWPAWLCWIIPMVGAGLTPVLAKIDKRVRDYAAVAFSLAAAALTLSMIPYLLEGRMIQSQVEWILLPGSPILGSLKAGVLVDPLSVILANVVAVIGALIMIYSLGYMKDDPSLTRYWFFMNLFIGDMLLLVLSDNFIQLLFGWEGVGLCSYALIGFWYRDSMEDWLRCWVGEGREAYPPSHCGMKAFITTRIGDVAMLIGLFIILAYAGTLNYLELQEGAILRVPVWLLAPAAILLLGGPIGKSAQLPLMEWLPDAMAGPTTVSALIHAATMVKAGVYLVGRIFPILYTAAWHGGSPNQIINFFYAAAWIGALTALVAGTQAMASTEIKKVLAYSTVSQIGYMMLGLGVAGTTAEYIIGYTGGVFHLMSHALFKAALFLAAGAVIHASHSRFMHHMGGLKRGMPITFWSATLAGFSLMGVPLAFSGFWSKDMILEASLTSGQTHLFIIAALTVAVTAFYTLRMIGLAFLGEESSHLKALRERGVHVHEAPRVMWIPFTILTILTIVFGLQGSTLKAWLEEGFRHFLSHLIPAGAAGGSIPVHASAWLVPGISAAMLVVGSIPAYLLYIGRSLDPSRVVGEGGALKALWRFLHRRWYINRFYYRVLLGSFTGFSRWALSYLELGGIDRFNYALSGAVQRFSSWLRRSHTGILPYNMVGLAAGLLLLILLLLRASLG
ncbi:MAG: NADH-quinone oxidoreductase subunit L [Candidatus Bathyarchaeia archaeon]